MEQRVRKFSISPGAIASSSIPKKSMALRAFEINDTDSGTAESSPFVLSAAEWLEIQLYVEKGLALPDTADKMARQLGLPPSTDLRDYADLLGVYHGINLHVSEWKKSIFPESVSLATDVYTYSLKARDHYEPILYWADMLWGNPADKDAVNRLADLLKSLSQTVRNYQDRCRDVSGKIKVFADQTLMDKINLTGADGKSGIVGIYKNRHKDAAGMVARIKKDIEDDYRLINDLNRDYNYYMAEKAKTASYAWVWPFGTIAAAIKAGEYGGKARDALNRISQVQKVINNLSGDLSRQTQTLYILDHVLTETSGISSPLSRGLSIIQSIEGRWKAIADDFEALAELIVSNIAEALPCIKDLGVEAAVRAWEAVGESADGYRQHAYIQIN